MTYNELLTLVEKRRSLRRFKPDPLPDDLIHKLIEVARWAPSGFNTQPWEFFVVKDAALRKRIVEITASYWQQSKEMEAVRPEDHGRTWKLSGMTDTHGDYSQAPVYIILCGDPRTQEALPMGVQTDRHRRQLIYQSSLANAFLYLHLAATTLGLASQWYSVVQTPYASCLIKDLLNIPDALEIYDMMVLGYPAVKPPKKFLRDTADMIHWDGRLSQGMRDDAAVKRFVHKARNWTIGTHSRTAEE
jgi:nitroreductase